LGFLPRVSDDKLRTAILELARQRGPSSSICPSDAARVVGGDDWRDLMDEARDVARTLAKDGDVVITQGGESLDPDAKWRGPIRIRATE
jgi:dihydropteroate synthase